MGAVYRCVEYVGSIECCKKVPVTLARGIVGIGAIHNLFIAVDPEGKVEEAVANTTVRRGIQRVLRPESGCWVVSERVSAVMVADNRSTKIEVIPKPGFGAKTLDCDGCISAAAYDNEVCSKIPFNGSQIESGDEIIGCALRDGADRGCLCANRREANAGCGGDAKLAREGAHTNSPA
jgi:hypothetical protein